MTNKDFDEEEFAKELHAFQKALGINTKKTIAERVGEFLGGLLVFSAFSVFISLGLYMVIYVWSLIITL